MPNRMKVGQSKRQGDILITKVTKEDWEADTYGCRPLNRQDGKLILAEGEATGHHHELSAGTLLEDPKDALHRYIKIDRGTSSVLVHDEHDQMVLPSGYFIMTRKREYVPKQAPRRVYD